MYWAVLPDGAPLGVVAGKRWPLQRRGLAIHDECVAGARLRGRVRECAVMVIVPGRPSTRR